MRYFLILVLLITAAVLSIAGFRGGLSRNPPFEVFPDMKRQLKFRPQKPNVFFEDRTTSRLPVAGSIPNDAILDESVAFGFRTGTTNFVETNPVPITAEVLARGRERYTIYCVACHSAVGDGNGITGKYGMVRAGNFHDPRIIRMPDGELFNTITQGKNLMPSYASQVTTMDRWAIIAYIRALQRTRLANIEDVPSENRATLK